MKQLVRRKGNHYPLYEEEPVDVDHIKAQVWTIQRATRVLDIPHLNTLIPSDVKPGGPYSCIEWVLVVKREAPQTPTQDSCLRVQYFSIPDRNCSVHPIIWNDKIWHTAGGWKRSSFFLSGHTRGGSPRRMHYGVDLIIPDDAEEKDESWEYIGLYTPDDYADLPMDFHLLPMESFDLELGFDMLKATAA